jgi:hypothetical protein
MDKMKAILLHTLKLLTICSKINGFGYTFMQTMRHESTSWSETIHWSSNKLRHTAVT